MTARTPEPPDFPASQLFLRRLAFSLVHDEARAEDLVQDTWAAWAEHRPSGLAEPRAWLARVLRNRAFNQKRGDERRARRETLAGRPDPSTPETDGTLEAQAQLLEALRKLDEPYRSTLVQRYYHDLAPKEIAERSGTPLNTVKARLARGLERLRAELDRRYGGDRSAWCHWLTVLGAPVAPIAAPSGSAAATQGAPPFAGMGGGGGMSLLGWLALAGVLAVGAVLKSEWGREPRVEQESVAERQASVPPRETIEPAERGRVAAPSEEPGRPGASFPLEWAKPAAEAPGPLLPPASETRPLSTARESFDWPQYAGGADHDNYREREDEIYAPKVLWFMPGCAGQPTLEGSDLYTGGLTILRLDPATGRPTGAALDLITEGMEGLVKEAVEGRDSKLLEAVQRLTGGPTELDPNDGTLHMVAPAPVVTTKLVLARRTRDGGVSAFDRELVNEVWSWTPDQALKLEAAVSRVPLCLASDKLVLVAQSRRLIALRVADGTEAWRFACNGWISMVPASDGERVFFGTDRGLFVCLDLGTGAELWKTGADGFGTTAPVVIGKRVLAADVGALGRWDLPTLDEVEAEALGSERGQLHAFDAKTGRLLWRSPVDGFRTSNLGVGPRQNYVVAGYGAEVGRFDASSGKRGEGHRVQTQKHPYGSPTVVGKSLVFGDLDGSLYVHELESGKLRWAFRVARAKVFDFVHTGKRIYVSTSIGLFCVADDPTQAATAAGFVLEWNGNPREPSYLSEENEEKK